ncbi:MAG: alpha/beta fold hydrolase [Candidatus Dormibacteraceae bacterium]
MIISSDICFRHNQILASGAYLHVVEAGDPSARPIVFLHGWPESWRSWQPVMQLASERVRAIALDLPGVGKSTGETTDGSKRKVAQVVHSLITTMGLQGVTLVGQDVGGMVAYSYLRTYGDLARAIIMDVAVPGIDPWDQILCNPHIWHFAMHSIPALPERLVQGRQKEYFDYFYDILSSDPANITPAARSAYVEAYSSDSALTAGFNWYRTFSQDAMENKRENDRLQVSTPLLYLRGELESGDISTYVAGFAAAGVEHVEQGLVPGAGHFTQEEAPQETWRLIADFAGL